MAEKVFLRPGSLRFTMVVGKRFNRRVTRDVYWVQTASVIEHCLGVHIAELFPQLLGAVIETASVPCRLHSYDGATYMPKRQAALLCTHLPLLEDYYKQSCQQRA